MTVGRQDVIVIGGGIAGVSIGSHLARFRAGRGLLLERGRRWGVAAG